MSGAAEHSLYMEESAAGPSSAAEHVPVDAAAVGSDCAGDRPADPTFTFDLRWCSGRLIKRFENGPDLDVERFVQDMDEGIVDGIPHAGTTESREWLEYYCICHGNATLDCAKNFERL